MFDSNLKYNAVLPRKQIFSILFPIALVISIAFAALSVDFNRLDGEPAFEKAIEIIKKYETLHKAGDWPYIGYGHRARAGEGYKRGVVLSQAQAESLLRKDLKKYIRSFSAYGPKAILLGTLSYNIGTSAVKRSEVIKNINGTKQQLRIAYLAHCRFQGMEHAQIRQRRIEEFDTLYDLLTPDTKTK